MSAGVIIALVLAIPVGLTLGALGGGGAILTLPIFVFIAGIPTAEAVAMSLVTVGGASLPAAGLHYWRGNFHRRAALYFAATGVIASYFGSYLTQMVSQRMLLGIFAALMLIAGGAMIRRRSDLEQRSRCNIVRCLIIGAIVGGLTGFLGVGGGFMIVPALVLFAGIETKDAVGASLAIITLNAAAGLVGQIQHITIDWHLTLAFLGLTVLGMFAGLAVAEKVPSDLLKHVFGWLVIVLALTVGGLAAASVSMPSGSGS